MRKKSTHYFKTTAKFSWLVNDDTKTIVPHVLKANTYLLTCCLAGTDNIRQTVPPTPGPNEKIFFKWVHVSTNACFRPVTVPSVKREA